MIEHRTFSEPDLIALCAGWQRRLRLSDWTVKLQVVRKAQMSRPGMGCSILNLKRRQLLIQLCDPLDYLPNAVWPNDQEVQTAHELLHCHFEPFIQPDTTPLGIAQEQAIDSIAYALVNLKRGG